MAMANHLKRWKNKMRQPVPTEPCRIYKSPLKKSTVRSFSPRSWGDERGVLLFPHCAIAGRETDNGGGIPDSGRVARGCMFSSPEDVQRLTRLGGQIGYTIGRKL
jgi:hypothetical protein